MLRLGNLASRSFLSATSVLGALTLSVAACARAMDLPLDRDRDLTAAEGHRSTRLGLHVTQEELDIWRQRAISGPYNWVR